ncbi:MAG: late competence development ComFB family protein [Sporomusaceae bacterium]|nr:late competence development ComFB family protein [Sporomusaceae bacterium]
MILKNYMEDLVWQKLTAILSERPHICSCERCRHDMAAIALNLLPSKYIVKPLGETYTRTHLLETQFNADIVTAISRAVTIVKNNPNHSDDEKKV